MGRKGEEKSSSNGNGHVKFRYADAERYMDVEMVGGNEALAEGLKSLASALSRGTAVAVRGLGSAKASSSAPPSLSVPTPETEDEMPTDASEAIEGGDHVDNENLNGSGGSGKP